MLSAMSSPAPPPAPSPVPLARALEGRVVAGVAAGVGRTLAVDPVAVRVVLVLLTLTGGAGLVLYLLAWAALPGDGAGVPAAERALARFNAAPDWLRVVAVVLAALAFSTALQAGEQVFAGLLLIGLGVLLFRRHDPAPAGAPAAGRAGGGATAVGSWTAPVAPAVPPAAPGAAVRGPGAAPAPPTVPAAWPPPPMPPVPTAPTGTGPVVLAAGQWAPAAPVVPATPPPTAPGAGPPTAPGAGPPAAPGAGPSPLPGAWPAPAVPPAAWSRVEVPPLAPRPRSVLGRLTLAVALLTLGVAAVLDLLDAVPVAPEGYVALLLVVLGAGLVLGARVGRTRWPIAVGILVLPALVLTDLASGVPGGEVGDVFAAPRSLGDLEDAYRVTAGTLTLDLRELQGLDGTTEVDLSMGVGAVWVLVPPDLPVTARTRADTGVVDVLGRVRDGEGLDLTVTGAGADGAADRLALDIEVGAGYVEVTRLRP